MVGSLVLPVCETDAPRFDESASSSIDPTTPRVDALTDRDDAMAVGSVRACQYVLGPLAGR
jgi:hypothetical protein